ncbi:hypothetical protein [Pectobacterium carotovorum]|uniref:hypothetical protein n=1 Tax=Pectobacterium carotovorum TaxID=554 RepID=UPI003016AADD
MRKNKPLTSVQRDFMEALRSGKGYVPRRPTNSTGQALFRRGLVRFEYGYNRWVLTDAGLKECAV